MGMDRAAWLRANFRNISGSLSRTAAQTGSTLAACRAGHTIFIQSIVAYITTDAAQSWRFEDTTGTPVKIAELPTSPGDETRWQFDFTDEGVPLGEGKDFVLGMSAAGLAGHIEWVGYMKPTAASMTLASSQSGT